MIKGMVQAALTGLMGCTVAAAWALPTNVTVTPPTGARFISGQKFDLRVEGKGTGPFSATLAIDGNPVTFTSGAQNTSTTDGISSAGYGGFNRRGYSLSMAGTHTITASFTDSTGTVNVSSKISILNVSGNRRPAKNIIICLGDGMGAAHTTAARIVQYGVTAGRPNDFLNIQKFPGTGLVATHSLNSIITDSAPGMSCYVSGNHNFNGQEGVYPANVTNPFYAPRVEYLSEFLHRTKGTSLGLVSTADIEDATPAANAVHTTARGNGTGICDQYLDESNNTGLAVLLGGGRRWFLPATNASSSRTSGTDYPDLPADLKTGWNITTTGATDVNRNLIQDFMNAGFSYTATYNDPADTYPLQSILNGSVSTPNKLLGLYGYGNMNVALDKLAKRRGALLEGAATYAVDDYAASYQPMLPEMTEAALKVLSKNTNGFVLMVEGAHIDKQSHYMDADRAIMDTIEFDKAVKVCKDYADALGDTVVIVTADHECSGFALIGALSGGIANLKTLASDVATTDPAVQPNRQKVVGVYDAAAFPAYTIAADGYPASMNIDGKLLVGFGGNADRYEGWLTKPQPIIDSLLPTNLINNLTTLGYPTRNVVAPRQSKTTDPFGDSRGFFIRGQAAGVDQAVHTATEIPIYAYSSGSRAFQLFYGVQENTDVFFKLMSAALGGY